MLRLVIQAIDEGKASLQDKDYYADALMVSSLFDMLKLILGEERHNPFELRARQPCLEEN